MQISDIFHNCPEEQQQQEQQQQQQSNPKDLGSKFPRSKTVESNQHNMIFLFCFVFLYILDKI